MHLLAQQDLGLRINKLADDILADDMFELLNGLDKNKNSPPVTAALESRGAALASMLNFYSSNINMSAIHKAGNSEEKNLIHKLLHEEDENGHTSP